MNSRVPSAAVLPWSRAAAAACLAHVLLGFVSETHAQSLADIDIEASGCPSVEQLQGQLEPLLSTKSDSSQEPTRRLVRVMDLGDHYRIEIASAVRDVSDPERDCLERARVAAVFIALNLEQTGEGPAAAESPAPGPLYPPKQRAAPPAPTESTTRTPPRSASHDAAWGAEAFGSFETTPGWSAMTGGAGLGLWHREHSWRFRLTGAGLAPVDAQVSDRSTPTGAVSMIRLPLGLSVARAWRIGAAELGPRVGVALDLLHFQGRGFDDSHSAWRANGGLLVGATSEWPLGRSASWFVELHATAFPRAYRLVVEPTGALSYTPRWWFGLGVGARLAVFN